MLIIGAGGHAKSCIDIIHASPKFMIKGLIGSADQIGQKILGYPVIGTDEDCLSYRSDCDHAFIGVGQIKTARIRQNLYSNLRDIGYFFPSFISSAAYLSSFASLGAGVIVMSGAVVNADAKVGENTIVNSHVLLEHDAVVGDHCHISTGARVNGGVKIHKGSFIGSGAILREGISIGENCVVGAGQLVLKDVPANSVVRGLL